MTHDGSWRELYRCDNLNRACMVATCLNAMEFETRLLDKWGRPIEAGGDAGFEPAFIIHVPRGDWAMLDDVLPELIDEQLQFDSALLRLRTRAGRRDRFGLALLVGIVIVMATFGLIEI